MPVGMTPEQRSASERNRGRIAPEYATLSPDNKKVIFSIREEKGVADIGIYDLATGKFNKINPTGKSCLSPIYSRDGKTIAFVQRDGRNANVFIMNSDGTNPRQVTYTNNKEGEKDHSYDSIPVYKINALPSFSPDGQRIIYLQSRVMRKRSMGGEMVSHWDIHEQEFATGKQKQLTNYRFYAASRPYYLPNGKGIVFSASGAKGDIPETMYAKNDNEILIMDYEHPHPYRAFEHDTYAVKPSVSNKGELVFISKTNELDGTVGKYTYDLFMRTGNKTLRITNEKFPATIRGLPHISADGSHVVFLASDGKNEDAALWIVKTGSNKLINLGRPWSSK